jgi:hypothetical protein
MPQKTFNSEKTLISHLAKVQYHRWYQLYERDMTEKRIANQMEVLADEIVVKSAAGEMKGKENYPPRLAVYKGWRNAHHVQNITVTEGGDNKLKLEADVRYQNIQPDGSKKSYTIHYSTELKKNGDQLPQFTFVGIQPIGETQDVFEDAYPKNRINSLLHYWMALMERVDGNVEPFRELLTKDFLLNFSTASQIDSIEKLGAWLNGSPKTLQQSSHHPEKLSIKKINESEYEMTVELDWYGIAKDGNKLTAKTKHIWQIVDDVEDRFAKIKRADVIQIEPLTTVQ